MEQKKKQTNIKALHIHITAQYGHMAVVRHLVEHGADKEAKDETDWTPLHLAAHNGHLETVKFLVEIGANKDAITNFGLLVETGANKEAITIEGKESDYTTV
jgi:ankyrin repeat protein